MMDQISVDTSCDAQRRYFYSSKFRLVVSKGGANSFDMDALGFYF